MRMHALVAVSLFTIVFAFSSPWAISQGGVPAYNAAPPAKGKALPPILGKDELWGPNSQYDFQTHAYELAKQIPNVLHQQPCYCYCDRGMGHKSLHSCFEGIHGAQCSTCLRELYYTYTEYKKGRSAARIREGIIKGEWKLVDLQAAASIN